MKKGITAIISSALLAAGMASVTAVAQTPAAGAGAEPPTTMAVPKQNITDAKLKKFVATSIKLSDVAVSANKELAAQHDANKQLQVRQDAEAKMTNIVQSNGFSVEEFKGIGLTVQNDPDLRAKAQKMAEAS